MGKAAYPAIPKGGVMKEKYDGWALKNKWGSILLWTIGESRREARRKVPHWKELAKEGHKIIKIKVVEAS